MSDLDADLYGDLYGNDEQEYSNDQVTHEEKDEETPVEAATADPRPPPTVVKEEPPEAKPIPVVPTTNYSSSTAAASGSTVAPTFTQPPATQQIPTYEQPQPSDYRDSQPTGREGGYQNIPVNERTVRPSEMKDEG
ncbi:hypothetical protein DXG03_006295 [Asterophora parasitica]|uniref:Uncharacterized protein n=1 Tax=Asterophora parasitica TaxID=117018 RepID=A0A9P7G581_9AGAR|nr:hypothetical protein DXG03_006295 [Asterophora parasitica]